MAAHDSHPRTVLTINGGSSSIKFALFEEAAPAQQHRRLEGSIERLGTPEAHLKTAGAGGVSQAIAGETPQAAVHALLDWLQGQPGVMDQLSAVAHRVVHGGPRLFEPQRVTPAVLSELRAVAGIDPDHLPAELGLIDAFAQRCAPVPQMVCFDTAFHRNLPRVAKLLPLPRRYEESGVHRYGFHGLSYEYLLDQLQRTDPTAARGRVVLAHLGSGASLAAVHEGKPVDTTMSFTPTAGLVMGTRTGDLDPGVLVYLMRSQRATADELDRIINHESGLKGISQTSADTRDLLARRSADPRADDAINAFCHAARKHLAAMAASLGGIDTLVFAGGIGENAPTLRAEICQPLAFLGIDLDPHANEQNADVLSSPRSSVSVRRIPTDEQVVLARAALSLLPTK